MPPEDAELTGRMRPAAKPSAGPNLSGHSEARLAVRPSRDVRLIRLGPAVCAIGTAWLVAIGLSIAAASTATNAQFREGDPAQVVRSLPDDLGPRDARLQPSVAEPAAPGSDEAPGDPAPPDAGSNDDAGLAESAEPQNHEREDLGTSTHTDDSDRVVERVARTDDGDRSRATEEASEEAVEGKLDGSLRQVIERGDLGAQRIIIRARPGASGRVRAVVEDLGDRVVSEQAFVGTLTVDVHTEDIVELAAHPGVERLSLDEIYEAEALAPHSTGRPDRADDASHAASESPVSVPVASASRRVVPGDVPVEPVPAMTAMPSPHPSTSDSALDRAPCATPSPRPAAEWGASGIVRGNHFVIGGVVTCSDGNAGPCLWGSPPESPPEGPR